MHMEVKELIKVEDIWLYPSANDLMLFLPLSGSPNPTEQLPERGFVFVFIVD